MKVSGRQLRKVSDLVISSSFVIVILVLITILLALLSRLIANTYLVSASSSLNVLSLVLSAMGLASFVYQKQERNRATIELRQEFDSVISARSVLVTDVLKKYVPIFDGFSKPEVEKMTKRFWTEFQNKGALDSDMEYDLVNELFAVACGRLSIEYGERLFLIHQYFSQNLPSLIQRFKDSLNQSNLTKEGSPENIYSRLLTLQSKYSLVTLEELRKEEPKVTKEEIENVAAESQGQQVIVQKIEEIIKDQESASKLTSLQRIVKRIILEGYVSETGLLSLMKNDNDLVFVMKSEASLGNLKTVFLKNKEVTPFKKVLLSHGFVQVARASAGTFLIPATKLPEEYRSQIPLYMEKVILPQVDDEWKRLQKQYDFKRLQRITYSYIAFRVKRPELRLGEFNTRIKPEVVEIINPISVKETAQALASHIFEIPNVLRKMEIDAVVDTGTESMKLALRNCETAIREELKKQDIRIGDITDYRKVDQDSLTRLIQTNASGELAKISPKARIKFDDRNASKISQEIIANSTDIFNLVTGIGIKPQVAAGRK